KGTVTVGGDTNELRLDIGSKTVDVAGRTNAGCQLRFAADQLRDLLTGTGSSSVMVPGPPKPVLLTEKAEEFGAGVTRLRLLKPLPACPLPSDARLQRKGLPEGSGQETVCVSTTAADRCLNTHPSSRAVQAVHRPARSRRAHPPLHPCQHPPEPSRT